MMRINNQNGNNSEIVQTAVASHTSTAAETSYTEVAATLDNGAMGKPLQVECSGNIGGLIKIIYGSNTPITKAVQPNTAPTIIKIPKGSYPTAVNTINVYFECVGGVGTLIAVVGFGKA